MSRRISSTHFVRFPVSRHITALYGITSHMPAGCRGHAGTRVRLLLVEIRSYSMDETRLPHLQDVHIQHAVCITAFQRTIVYAQDDRYVGHLCQDRSLITPYPYNPSYSRTRGFTFALAFALPAQPSPVPRRCLS